MRIAIAGKGGSGKTTLSGTLARILARRGRTVLAIDADSNPNLAGILGIPSASTETIAGLPRDLLERRTAADGTVQTVFAADPDQLIAEHGVRGPDGVQLLVMGKVGHAGSG
jgi:CO dehydrogenase maturation factor